jgi:hypothetical protein
VTDEVEVEIDQGRGGAILADPVTPELVLAAPPVQTKLEDLQLALCKLFTTAPVQGGDAVNPEAMAEVERLLKEAERICRDEEVAGVPEMGELAEEGLAEAPRASLDSGSDALYDEAEIASSDSAAAIATTAAPSTSDLAVPPSVSQKHSQQYRSLFSLLQLGSSDSLVSCVSAAHAGVSYLRTIAKTSNELVLPALAVIEAALTKYTEAEIKASTEPGSESLTTTTSAFLSNQIARFNSVQAAVLSATNAAVEAEKKYGEALASCLIAQDSNSALTCENEALKVELETARALAREAKRKFANVSMQVSILAPRCVAFKDKAVEAIASYSSLLGKYTYQQDQMRSIVEMVSVNYQDLQREVVLLREQARKSKSERELAELESSRILADANAKVQDAKETFFTARVLREEAERVRREEVARLEAEREERAEVMSGREVARRELAELRDEMARLEGERVAAALRFVMPGLM